VVHHHHHHHQGVAPVVPLIGVQHLSAALAVDVIDERVVYAEMVLHSLFIVQSISAWLSGG
jgi:hypothetical protein